MSIEFIFLPVLFLVLAFVGFWYANRSKPKGPSPQPETDPFLQQVAAERARIDEAVAAAVQQHERELEKRFSSDTKQLKIKEQLSQFARRNKLDEALIVLWEEIKHYPEEISSQQDSDKWKDSDKWNKLNLTGIIGASEKDANSVEFLHNRQRFKVKEQIKSETRTFNVSLSFFEDDDEVFSIDCLVNSKNDGTSYICKHISAFKKRGNWPKVLLEYCGLLQIEIEKSLNEVKYFRANEIKGHFEE